MDHQRLGRSVHFRRGAQKSVFKFGGSAVAIFGEPGAWCPAADILEHTPRGMETIVRLGEPVARNLRAVSGKDAGPASQSQFASTGSSLYER